MPQDTVTVSDQLNKSTTHDDSMKLDDAFKRGTLEAAKECTGQRPRLRGGSASGVTQSRAARIGGDSDQYMVLLSTT